MFYYKNMLLNRPNMVRIVSNIFINNFGNNLYNILKLVNILIKPTNK